jgi:aspartate 1-decarboxylase
MDDCSRKTGSLGTAAHLIKKGEEVIILGFELSDQPVELKNIIVDDNNHFLKSL